MARILSGIPVREKVKVDLIERVRRLDFKPFLVVVQVGDREDSNIYIRNKIKFGESLGVGVILKKFDQDIGEAVLIKQVEQISQDKNVHGIIIQLPLPEGIDSTRVINSIPKNKDADGLTTSPLTPLLAKERGREENIMLVTPATARAVESILDYYEIPVAHKKVAVIGRSKLAGGPIAISLRERGAEVFVCHKGTENTKDICKSSDIIVSAAGQAGLVGRDFVKEGQVVIDVGINKIAPPPAPSPKGRGGEKDGLETKPKLVGDVNFDEVAPIVEAITPVPGGVGPLTVACLFENLLDLTESQP